MMLPVNRSGIVHGTKRRALTISALVLISAWAATASVVPLLALRARQLRDPGPLGGHAHHKHLEAPSLQHSSSEDAKLLGSAEAGPVSPTAAISDSGDLHAKQQEHVLAAAASVLSMPAAAASTADTMHAAASHRRSAIEMGSPAHASRWSFTATVVHPVDGTYLCTGSLIHPRQGTHQQKQRLHGRSAG